MSYVLNWDALVDEAVRRRKTEGLTQEIGRAHV